MAEIINLRRLRKSRHKVQAETQAAGNRARSGASLADRQLAEARDNLALARHEGHRLVKPPRDDG